MRRAALFAITGIAYFAFWVVARPSHAATTSMTEWPNVLSFSAILLLLAVALVVFGRMLAGSSVRRWSAIGGAGVAAASVANILEDGLRIDAAFFGFVIGMIVLDVALIALAVVIARAAANRDRVMAFVPAGTLVGILLFVEAGGPVMLVTWLGLGVLLWRSRGQTASVVSSRTPPAR